MAQARGARFQLTPWSRAALLEDQERAIELAHDAQRLGAYVSLNGASPTGPWIVDLTSGGRSLRFRGTELHDTLAFGLERWAAGASDDGFGWLAGPDLVAHAQPERRPTWTACKQRALDERHRHPEKYRCAACWRALDRNVRATAQRGAA